MRGQLSVLFFCSYFLSTQPLFSLQDEEKISYDDILPKCQGFAGTVEFYGHYDELVKKLFEKYCAVKPCDQLNDNDKLGVRIVLLIIAMKYLEDDSIFMEDIYEVQSSVKQKYSMEYLTDLEVQVLTALNWQIELPHERILKNGPEQEEILEFPTWELPAPGETAWFDKYIDLKYPAHEGLFIVTVPGAKSCESHKIMTMTLEEFFLYDGEIITRQHTSLIEKALELQHWPMAKKIVTKCENINDANIFNNILHKSIASGSRFADDDDREYLIKFAIKHGADYLSMRWCENEKNILHMSVNQSYFSWLLELPSIGALFFDVAKVGLVTGYKESSSKTTVNMGPWLYAYLYQETEAMEALEDKHGAYRDWDSERLVTEFYKFRNNRNKKSEHWSTIEDPTM